jgi:sporulation protein YlmC with PRC-barrel domain
VLKTYNVSKGNDTEESKIMDIPVDVPVHCSDGMGGRSTCVLINPVRNEVTHLVVKEAKAPHVERVVPIEEVSETTPEVILLRCTRDELEQMAPFVRTEYIVEKMPDMDYAPGGYVGLGSYMMWPYVIPDSTQMVAVEHKQIPLGELAIKRGTRVEATDGHVGRVDEFLVDPKTEHITHLVMREGHLWGQRDMSIPVSEIKRIGTDAVHLKLSKDEIEALPAIAVRRWRV